MRTIAALLLGVLLTAGSVLYASQTQSRVADENFREARAAKQLTIEVLQRERALEAFSVSGHRAALEDYALGGRRIRAELARAQRLSTDSRAEQAAIAEQERALAAWDTMAEAEMAAKDVDGAVEA